MTIDKFPLEKFIAIYCDKEYGELTEAQAKHLISQYHDAMADEGGEKNTLVARIEYLNSFVNRIKILVYNARQSRDMRFIEALKEDGFKYQGDTVDDEQLDRIELQLKKYEEIELPNLKKEYESDAKKGVPINYEWFLQTCINISDMCKYPIRIENLNVKEFCIRYKSLVKYVKSQEAVIKK